MYNIICINYMNVIIIYIYIYTLYSLYSVYICTVYYLYIIIYTIIPINACGCKYVSSKFPNVVVLDEQHHVSGHDQKLNVSKISFLAA